MRKAGDVVTAFFANRYGSEFIETARSTAGLFSSWKGIVAEVWPRTYDTEQSIEDVPAAAVHSQIKELERGVLLVEADHPGWIQILQTRQGELLSAVQKKFPDLGIRGIAFRLSRESFSYTGGKPRFAEAIPSAPAEGSVTEPGIPVTEKEEPGEDRNHYKHKDREPERINPGCPGNPAASENSGVVRKSSSPEKPRDEEFYAALRGLEESIKKRNGL